MPFRILLVDPDSAAAAASKLALARKGYHVAPASTFEEATRQMALDYPDLLVTKVRLGAFNGLHLLLRCRADHPDLPVIIIGTPADRTADMSRFGAEFVTCPIDHASFLALVATLLSGCAPCDGAATVRRGPLGGAVMSATASDRDTHAVELSAGGVPAVRGEPDVEVAVPPDDNRLLPLGLGARAISGGRGKTPTMKSGSAEIALVGSETIRRWRRATERWRWRLDSLN
jgi:CheY-like chemotaxis protein